MKTYTVKIDGRGTKFWYLNGELHREDGPAVEYANGNKYWYFNDKFHRENGPAIEWASGAKFWHRNGRRHREDGPAIEYADGDKEWYLNGEKLTEKQFNKRINKNLTPVVKVIEIDGIKYELKKIE
jgi:hypothetical protein